MFNIREIHNLNNMKIKILENYKIVKVNQILIEKKKTNKNVIAFKIFFTRFFIVLKHFCMIKLYFSKISKQVEAIIMEFSASNPSRSLM